MTRKDESFLLFFIVSPGWDDHSTFVKRSFHVGETIVPQLWNDKNIVSNGFSSTILWIWLT